MVEEILKQKKKKNYLLISREFNDIEIGETPASDDNLVLGRSIEVSLAQITNDPKMQNIKVKFKVKEVKENKGYTELYEYFIIPTYIRRVVKPAKEKIDDSFSLITKDNVKLRIKPLLLTKAVTQNTILSHLRHKTRDFFSEYCKKNEYKKFLQDLITHNLQKDLKNTLNKIYPLSVCEIRRMEKL